MGNLSWFPKRTIKKYVRAGRGDQGVQGGRERRGFGLFFSFFSLGLETMCACVAAHTETRRMDRWMDADFLRSVVCEPRTQGGMAAAGACRAVKNQGGMHACMHGESSTGGAGCPVLRRRTLVVLADRSRDRPAS
jgi:hypothetical protein